MNILIIVNESPWDRSLGATALRMARAAQVAGAQILAVYFREDGVYHAQKGRATDSGTPDLFEEWQTLARLADCPLLVCTSSAQRRFNQTCSGLYREAGLPEVLELLSSSDRVVSF